MPDQVPPILVSGFGPTATALAGRIGDRYCATTPDPELIRLFDISGGAGKPKHAARLPFALRSPEGGISSADDFP